MYPRFSSLSLFALAGALALAPVPHAASRVAAPSVSAPPGTVAVRAGTIYVGGDAAPIHGGTLLVRDGRIVEVGTNVNVPPGARIVDYGADAVITPGFISADSTFGAVRGSDRTADPFVRAADNFDPYASYVFALQEGVVAAYIAPARGRLIAGEGAVVRLTGEKGDFTRVMNAAATVHGAITEEARNTPGYWVPPVPATVDIGLGFEHEQLPKSLMGAVVALQELFELAAGNDVERLEREYGAHTGARLKELIEAKVPWRIAANSEAEIRALLELFKGRDIPLIIDGANEAGALADEIARAGARVILDAPIAPNQSGRDFGKERDARWPRYDTAAALAKAGVPFAITPPNNVGAHELRFAAAVMSRGGLDPDVALRAITIWPAQMLGVADRLGSLEPGKDAEFSVFSGHPLSSGASPLASWGNGDITTKKDEGGAVVLHVEELHLGDGTVLSPGEISMRDGKIVEVARRVGRPAGATVISGRAAMPGMIDALGHLGLEGSTRVPPTRFELKRIVEPGDFADRRVAKAGVTTVNLTPRDVSRSGAPMLAYKPAGDDFERMVIDDPSALRFRWSERNRRESGKALREALAKAVEYKKKWDEYEEKRSRWVPPKATPAAEKADEAKDKDKETKDATAKKEGEGDKKDAEAEKKDAEKKDGEKKDADKAEADKKDADKKKEADAKKKKKKGEEEPPKPITGAWETKITLPPFEEARMRLYVLDEDGKISGSLRCASVSDSLIQVTGTRDKHKVTLAGDGSKGRVTIEAETQDGKLKGKLTLGATKVDFEAEQTATEYEIARRSEQRKPKDEKKPEVKGEPKAPPIDPELEPLRRALKGEAAVVVGVDREDEILDCVAAFKAVGIRPVLYGANEAWKIADKIKGDVAGILLTQRVVWTEPKTGAAKRNRYQELVAAGIPVAFHSAAEEGAADLPLIAAYAVAQGMSPDAALRALTFDAAHMLAIDDRVGMLASGMDADVLLLDGSPFEISSSVVRVWVNGKEVR